MAVSVMLSSCTSAPDVQHVYTTEGAAWQNTEAVAEPAEGEGYDLLIDVSKKRQQIQGFGACFSELGWTSLSLLSEKDRGEVIREFFVPDYGANFTICRMPIAANDFATEWYSYNEVKGDFNMYNFSIENDRTSLIPFIKSALALNPELKIWASPWSPPTWMKHNGHYASAYNGDNPNEKYRNGLAIDNQGYEGTDMFIVKPEYLKAYSLYFKLFLQAYRKEGIDIYGIMPQNEFNSAQVFPSCCWTAKSLATFVGDYLIPELEDEDVDIMFGTFERPNHLMVDTVLTYPSAANHIKAVGFQWAGKNAIAAIREKYPDMQLYQTEQECGNGKNDLHGLKHSWGLLKHYIENGVSVYDYWNFSLEKGGISRWGWAQNSLVVVDPETRTYEYTLEYYLMKHISHFVKPGAYKLDTDGSADSFSLAFENPDGSVAVVMMETEGKDKYVTMNLDGKEKVFHVKANSINTMVL